MLIKRIEMLALVFILNHVDFEILLISVFQTRLLDFNESL